MMIAYRYCTTEKIRTMIIVEEKDLEAIKLCALDIIENTPMENAFVGGTAIDILAILEKYIKCPLWYINEDGNVDCKLQKE